MGCKLAFERSCRSVTSPLTAVVCLTDYKQWSLKRAQDDDWGVLEQDAAGAYNQRQRDADDARRSRRRNTDRRRWRRGHAAGA